MRTAIPKLLVEDHPREGDVSAIEPKRDDTGTRHRLAEDADAIRFAAPICQRSREIGLVLCNGIYADRLDEADPCSRSGNTGR